MTALASKSAYPSSSSSSHNLSIHLNNNSSSRMLLAPGNRASYATNSTFSSDHSPTSSEFSVEYIDPDPVFKWGEKRVTEWLKSINAGQYVDIFRANNITGQNLMDIDQSMLKEMGIKKVGDRVRIYHQAKVFRHQEFLRKRNSNRDSFAMLDEQNSTHTPPSSGSPRPTIRGIRSEHSLPTAKQGHYAPQRGGSRPQSPSYGDGDYVNGRNGRKGGNLVAPMDTSWHSKPKDSASSESPKTGRLAGFLRPDPKKKVETPQTARFASHKSALSVDVHAANSGFIPAEEPWIRVIFDNGQSSMLSVEDCKNSREIILKTLRKGTLNESHLKSYCFYVLDGTDPDPAFCRRLSDSEVWRVCTDVTRRERERLMLRKIHAGEPEGSQLVAAANIANHQQHKAHDDKARRSQRKIERLTGESLPSMSFPMSPASIAERERHLFEAAQDLERREVSPEPTPRPRPRQKEAIPGARPESEFVVDDLETYFPEAHDEARKTVRESIRRSQRISRASSRLSIASNFSVLSNTSLRDAPPVPTISDRWLQQAGRPISSYRQSVASTTTLDPLEEEESPQEPNRESYVSFSEEDDSTLDSATLAITDPDGNTIQGLFHDEPGSSMESGDSLNKQLSQAIAEDGEDADEELTDFLNSDAYDDIKYIQGKLIGQGSFGTVYLALHAVTAELMAVKCVELPSTAGTVNDAKKNNMVEALKREIALLRELKHPRIVQYLGSSSDTNTLNIFLEYVPGGSIAKMLVDYGSLNEVMVTNLVRQTLVGLAYLHSKDIIHRDIKGANILVDSKGAVKISDFGISKRVQDSKTLLSETAAAGAGAKGRALPGNRVSLQGSVFWMAPEVVRQTAYTRKADIWSLGCLIVEMLTGSHPHPNMSQLQAIFKIGGRGAASNPSPEVPAHASDAAKEFLKQTFQVDHEMRPEATELLETAFLKVVKT